MSSQDLQKVDLLAYEQFRQRGDDLAWAGNWEEAAIAYRRAIALQDRDPLAQISLGLALFETGNLREALAAYERALQLNPGDVDALRKIAEILARQGEKLQAASTYMLLADSYMEARQPAEAVRAWQHAVRYDPLNRAAYRRLADAYRRGNRNDLAAQAVTALARVHIESGEDVQALSLAEEAIALDPDFAPARQIVSRLGAPDSAPSGKSRRGTGSLRGGVRRGTGGLRTTGPLQRPSATRGLSQPTGPLDPAQWDMEHLPEYAEHGGPSPTEIAQQRALARLAEAFFDGDSVDLSIEASKAQAIDLQTRGLVEEAARTYEEIIQAGGGSPDVYYTLGTLYQTMLRFDDAIRRFEQVTGSPDYGMAARFAIGQCYQSQGRVTDAMAYFQDALDTIQVQSVEPEQADEVIQLYEALADTYEATGDSERAESLMEELAEFLTSRGWDDRLYEIQARLGGTITEGGVESDFDDVAASQTVLAAMEIARRYQAQRQIRAAIEELYWVLPLGPFYLPLHQQLAELYLADGRGEDALAKLAMVAEVQITRSNPSQAIRALKRALEIVPTDQAVRGKVIDLLMSHGEIDEALEHYLMLAEGFYQLAQGDRAIEKLNEALRLAPRGNPEYEWSARIQRRLGDIHMQRLDWRRAATAFEGLSRARPDDLEVVSTLADLYFKMGADERGRTLIANTVNHMAEQGNSDSALQFLQSAIDQQPLDIELVQMMGEARAALGDNEGAALAWESAVERLVRRGDRAQGAALLRRLIGLHSSQEKRYRGMLTYLMKNQ